MFSLRLEDVFQVVSYELVAYIICWGLSINIEHIHTLIYYITL